MHVDGRVVVVFAFLCALLLATFAGCGDDDDDADDPTGDAGTDDDDNNDNDDDDDAQEPYREPAAFGPYAVGVKTLYLVDDTRHEVWGDMPRVLPLEVWYPSEGDGTINTIETMVGEVPAWAWDVLALVYQDSVDDLLNFATDAGRDATPLVEPGPFPLILFSHGLTAIRFQNFTLCEHLASHGFVVVSPDHYGNAVFTNIPQHKVVLYNALTLASGLEDRPRDVKFIFDRLREIAAEPDNDLPPIDFDRFGVTGHSLGATTTLQVGPMFDEVDAIAPLNPPFIGWYPQDYTRPMLMLQSRHDEIIGDMFNEPTERAFDVAAASPKLRIVLERGTHYSVTDACTLLPPLMINPTRGCDVPGKIPVATANRLSAGYLTAFFKTFVTSNEAYEPYLLENHWPDEMTLETVWPD